jgi:hypothetical protein
MKKICLSPLFLSIIGLALLSINSLANADFRALLVGIDYQNRSPSALIKPLCGGLNDVDDLYQLMTQDLGIPAEKIHVLRESQATRAAIINEFEQWLIEGSKAGDQLFFHYSGHGVLVPALDKNQSSDPTKKNDTQFHQIAEAFVPYDTTIDHQQKRIDNIIRDSDLQPLLQQLSDRELTLFIDSCHSGGITKSAGGKVLSVRRVDLPWVDSAQTQVTPLFSSRGTPRGSLSSTWHPPYRFFAAARYNQYAHEYPLKGCKDKKTQHFNGAMTYSLLDLLRKNPEAHYSNEAVFQHSLSYLRETIKLGDAIQKPQFFAPKQASQQPFVLLQQRQKASNNVVSPQPTTMTTIPSAQAAHIELWLTQRGKRRFHQGDKPTLYYHVKQLPTGQQHAWLTLLSIADDGSVTLLYPQPADFYQGVGSKAFLNAKVELGKHYQIPRKTLMNNENILLDVQLELDKKGKEHFKAILTSEPIVWNTKQWGAFKSQFAGSAGRSFLSRNIALAQQQRFWAEQDLHITVE